MTRQELKDFRRSYFFPTLECRAIGNAADANIIVALTFGRNTFPDNGLNEMLLRFGLGDNLHTREVFEQLDRARFDPGLTNFHIADRVWKEYQKNPDAHVYCQWEVAFVLWYERPEIFKAPETYRRFHVVWPFSEAFFDSYAVLEEVYKETRFLTPTYTRRALIIAQDYHIARVVAIAWKMGFEVMTGEPGIKDFDEKSVQPFTRSLNAWLLREYVVRLSHHPLKGKVRLSPPSPLTEPTLAAV